MSYLSIYVVPLSLQLCFYPFPCLHGNYTHPRSKILYLSQNTATPVRYSGKNNQKNSSKHRTTLGCRVQLPVGKKYDL